MGLEGGRSRKKSAAEKFTQMARSALFGAAAFTAASASDVGEKTNDLAQHSTAEKKAGREDLPRFDKFRRSTNVEDRRDEDEYTGERPRFIETDMNKRLAEIQEREKLEKSHLAKEIGIDDIKNAQRAIVADLAKRRNAQANAALKRVGAPAPKGFTKEKRD